MLASRAATGMLLVFATRIVRSISDDPVRGSVSRGNWSSTSVSSLPRSPQAT
jgi:hypothetical protein